jgi:hypothetical protein
VRQKSRTKDAKVKRGASPKRPEEKLHVHEPKVEKQSTKETKLPFSSDSNVLPLLEVYVRLSQALASFHTYLHANNIEGFNIIQNTNWTQQNLI